MTPEANDALHRVMADYPAVKWTADGPDTVILYFENSKVFVFLSTEEGGLDEAKARRELDVIIGALTDVLAPAAPEGEPEPGGVPADEAPPADVVSPEPAADPPAEESAPEPQPPVDPEPAPLPPEV